MTIEGLKQKLVEIDIPQDAYSLSGGLPNEAFCISNECDLWEVYYSERGQKSGLKAFAKENDACNYFYEMITSDSSLYPGV